jgi:hypothetical protein
MKKEAHNCVGLPFPREPAGHSPVSRRATSSFTVGTFPLA